MLPVFYIIPLFLIIIKLGALIRHSALRIVMLLILNLVLIGELISVYFSGGLIDYQFYVNLNLNDMISGLVIFKYQAILGIICFFVLLAICNKLSKLMVTRVAKRYISTLLIICILMICYKNGPISRLYEVHEVTDAEPIDFKLSLEKIGINPQNYPDKSQLQATAGKNIIVISMESMERGFLSNNFSQLTPNLNKLSQEFTYYPDMPMAPGSTWTLASMYTYMTGAPLFLGGYSTYLFENKLHSKLVNLGDILNLSGYQSRYLIGNPEFAGMGQAISLFGIQIVSEKTFPGRYPEAPFGLYDHDIFALARHQIEQLKDQPQPFALFISTVSTHAPDGFYDARMEQFIEPQPSNLEFTVASLDYNLGQFFAYLQQNNLLENTVIYLFPDHQMMGYGTEVINQLSEHPRSLYLITNASESVLGKPMNETIYQIDLPRLIINGAGIETNAKFLTDYLEHSEKMTFIQNNKHAIAVLNSSSFLEQ